MFVKCYLVEINSSLETMYQELDEVGINYTVESCGDGYMEITFETFSIGEIQDVNEIMKWYV